MAGNDVVEDPDVIGQRSQAFERVLPDNCVEYMLFVLEADAQAKNILSGLETVRRAAIELSKDLTRGYIWQRDGFGLEMKNEGGLHYLHGISDYGDSIEDEWLIVYMLRELTKQFSNLWVRVSDSDGEFLLVEAANVLPKWLNPENDANRAWIHGGQLWIIPLQQSDSGVPSKKMDLSQAFSTLQSAPDSLVHSTFIEAEAFYRLEKYPGQIQESVHHAVVTIPRRLAYVIHELPKSIAPAIEAFYLRDPNSLKPLLVASPERLTFPPNDLVDSSVKFTKVLYAQLKSQHFSAPPVWQDLLAASERAIVSGADEEDQKKHARLELGMKVTCGFEMLAFGAAKSNKRTVRELFLILEDLIEDGDSVLPADADLNSWQDAGRDDDDSWMDINFEDFEKELDGKASTSRGEGFTDTNAQADLRKVVSRFEAFLNDDKAGIDGAELDEMDEDDDEDATDSDEESGSEDRDVSFDEEEFARMMREMMGLPAGSSPAPSKAKGKMPASTSTNDLEEDSEDEEIRKLSEQMAAELNDHGALDLDPTPKKLKALKDKGKGKEKAATTTTEEIADAQDIDDDESGDEEVDIDYNLAKNLLESFKGQAGLVGPVGTMLADMGIRLPRDEDDDENE
ncbi:SGT1-domain-containing protein [Cryphonectria parasitica EP155]|uniref:SGT1-domain-containing protein n=1 Tax=Cryphonectria parasitica (strain ATCC 38755 / EP155) TaxID=660469 RepID=A0A9P4XZA0_CRYP1|nr:SGT1-domain-containing protein [Cryphonectria parasitica EP155]KAF3763753.1 SGT1-domain-containing protein [Cryphonectria parasitica EP155]